MKNKLFQSEFVLLLIFLLYSVGLSGLSIPLTGDQKVYLSIALEMREKHSWIIPYLYDVPNFLKPPFQYWMTLSGWNIFGFSILGALLPSVLALVGTAWVTNQISEQLTSKKTWLAGVFFAAGLGTMTYGTTAQMEIWIVLFYWAAWLAFLKERLICAFVLVGVMAWVKGPLYPALWVMSTMLWYLLHRRSKEMLRPKFIFSLGLGILVGMSWYVLAARTQSQAMFQEFFQKENLGKMQTHQGTPWGLWGEFLYSLLPWGIYLLVHFDAAFKVVRVHYRSFVAFALIPALFFTFFPYRVNTYLYLLTPLFAMIAVELDSKNKFAQRAGILFASLIAIVAVLICLRLVQGQWISMGTGFALMMTLVLWLLSLSQVGAWGKLSSPLAWFALSSLMMVNLVRMGAVEIGETEVAQLRATVHYQLGDHEIAYWVTDHDIWHERGLISSAVNKPIRRIEEKSDLSAFLKSGGTLILNDEQVLEGISLRCYPWIRLKRRLKFPLKDFLIEGISWGDPRITRKYQICKSS